jgi:hypothetical protein
MVCGSKIQLVTFIDTCFIYVTPCGTSVTVSPSPLHVTTTVLMPLKPSSPNLWEHHIPDSEGSEMEMNSAIHSKPETVVPTSDIYETEVYLLLQRLGIKLIDLVTEPPFLEA